MSTDFKWDDKLAQEFAEQYRFSSSRISIEQFKESKQPKPEWEIIQVSSPECGLYYLDGYKMRPNDKIYSVKRLSDGAVFTIGDCVTYLPVKNASWVIDNFFITNENKILARSKDNINCELIDKDLGKVVALLSTDNWLISYPVTAPKNPSKWDKEQFKYFSTKESAEEYILWNKPCLSLSKVLTRHDCIVGNNPEFIEAMKLLAKANIV